MTLGQIKCFVTVVDEQSFAKAANALFVSQPAISKSISKLEDELGFELLERKGGSLQLTSAGKTLYDFFVKSESDYRDIIAGINHMICEPVGTVRLGCPDTWDPSAFYDKIVSHFKQHYPSVKLSIECFRLPELLDRLHSGKLDLIMSHEFYPPVQYGLSVRKLTESRCGILYAKSYFSGIHSPADLNGIDFLVFDSDVEKKFGTVIKHICGDFGFVPNIKNCGRFQSAIFNMSCGNGVMFFTELDNIVNNKAYHFMPVNYKSPVNLIYPTITSNPRTHIFADELAALFQQSN